MRSGRVLVAAVFLVQGTGLEALARQLPKITIPTGTVKVVDPMQRPADVLPRNQAGQDCALGC